MVFVASATRLAQTYKRCEDLRRQKAARTEAWRKRDYFAWDALGELSFYSNDTSGDKTEHCDQQFKRIE